MNSATCLLQPYRVQSDKTSLVLARYEAGDYFLSNGGVASERRGADVCMGMKLDNGVSE